MRLVGRILLLVAGASLPAVVAVIGCNVESDPYKGIGNDIPNHRQAGGAQGGTPASSSASGTSTASGSSSSSGGGTANVCQCAWSVEGHGDAGACTMCGATAVGVGQACENANAACLNDALCLQALACVANCQDAVPTCTESCLITSPNYQALVACQCDNCMGECAAVSPIPCDIGDAGDGGDGG
jgi:hypothetical protein